MCLKMCLRLSYTSSHVRVFRCTCLYTPIRVDVVLYVSSCVSMRLWLFVCVSTCWCVVCMSLYVIEVVYSCVYLPIVLRMNLYVIVYVCNSLYVLVHVCTYACL